MLTGKDDTIGGRPVVLFLINSLAGGGAERVMLRLVDLGAQHYGRENVHLVLLDDEADQYAVPDWLTVHRLRGGGGLVASLMAFARVRRRIRPDLVVSFLTRSNICNVLSRGSGRSLISERVYTSDHHKGMRGAFSRLLIRYCYPRADRVVAVSHGIKADLATRFGVPGERIVTIANPIDMEKVEAEARAFDTVLPSRDFYLAMGRFIGTKNFPMLLNAFARARTQRDLVILGQGAQQAELQALTHDLGLGERVHFAGFQRNPFAILKSARAFLLPSNKEGFPNSLVEAMSLGIPVVSTNCPTGPSEILEDVEALALDDVLVGKYGILVPVDDPARFAEAIDLMEDQALHDDLARRAKERARHYSVAEFRRRFLQAMDGVIASGEERAATDRDAAAVTDRNRPARRRQ